MPAETSLQCLLKRLTELEMGGRQAGVGEIIRVIFIGQVLPSRRHDPYIPRSVDPFRRNAHLLYNFTVLGLPSVCCPTSLAPLGLRKFLQELTNSGTSGHITPEVQVVLD